MRFCLVITAFLLGPISSMVNAAPALDRPLLEERIDAELSDALRAAQESDRVPVVVILRGFTNLDAWSDGQTRQTRAGRAARLKDELQTSFARDGKGVRDLLDALDTSGDAENLRAHWIFHGFTGDLSPRAIARVAAHPAVELVRLAVPIAPPEVRPSKDLPGIAAAEEWNIEKVGAPDAWSMGYSGQGIVVGSFDTGVDGNHADLTSRYKGGPGSWWDPYGEHDTPYDAGGHGTHTTGTILGGNASGRGIGVAPDAQWIGAKAWSDGGISTITAFSDIFEWFLDPDGDPATDDAPAAVSNSWGFIYDGCLIDFRRAVLAWRAAGILPVFASGNSGPGEGSSESPGNYPETYSVGATSSSDRVASFSGRGPSDCDNGRIKPDLSAPGVSIRSSVYGGYQSWSGTSMATPHVTGAAAILLSVDGELLPEELEEFLSDTAVDRGSPGPDNDYGWGRLDVAAAVEAVLDRGSIVGTVTTNGGGPLADANIEIVELDRSLVTGPEGDYEFRVPGNETYTVRASAFGHASDDATIAVPIRTDITHDVDLDLLPNGPVRGRVTDDGGTPVVGAQVSIAEAMSAQSNSDGLYLIDDVPVGIDLNLAVSSCDLIEEIRSIRVPDTGGSVENFALATPAPDDMESGENGWSHDAITIFYGDDWHMSTEDAHSQPTSWKCGAVDDGDYGDYLDAGLVTRCYDIDPGTTLEFWHRIESEPNPGFFNTVWDGGIVEISEDGGNEWAQIHPSGGYPYSIVNNPANVLEPGTRCYGANRPWEIAHFDLHERSGPVQFRFRFASDGLVTRLGWFVDDVALSATDPNLDLALVDHPETMVPAERTSWTHHARNEEGRALPVDLWIETLAGGSSLGKAILYEDYIVQPDIDQDFTLEVPVPWNARPGSYEVRTMVGVYPDVVYATTSFTASIE